MYNKEYLYFNSLKGFRANPRDKSGRLDPRELNMKNRQLTRLTIKIPKGKEFHIHESTKFSAQYMEHLSVPKINCCSLHWIDIEIDEQPKSHNNRLIELGDKTLLIYEWKQFFDKLDEAIEERGFQYSRRKVEYYNPKQFDGDLTLHHKDIAFSWQNEYRILIAPTDNEPIKISIPGLKKISKVVDTKDMATLRIKIDN